MSEDPFFIKEKGLPLIQGNCPSCGEGGDRVLIMTRYRMNQRVPEHSIVSVKCVMCFGEFEAALKKLTKSSQ